MILKITKLLFLIVLIILLFFIFNKKENYLCFDPNDTDICKSFSCNGCIDNPIESYGEIINNSVDCFGNSQNKNFKDCKYNKIINPYNPKCVDFCINTYTHPENTNDSISGKSLDGEFIGIRFNHAFFTSKCGQCVDNFYKTIKKLTDTKDKKPECGLIDPSKS
jgi:hypothetical protein